MRVRLYGALSCTSQTSKLGTSGPLLIPGAGLIYGLTAWGLAQGSGGSGALGISVAAAQVWLAGSACRSYSLWRTLRGQGCHLQIAAPQGLYIYSTLSLQVYTLLYSLSLQVYTLQSSSLQALSKILAGPGCWVLRPRGRLPRPPRSAVRPPTLSHCTVLPPLLHLPWADPQLFRQFPHPNFGPFPSCRSS